MDAWYWTSGADLEKNCKLRDFPGGTVVKTASTAQGTDLIPAQGAKIPHTTGAAKKTI